MRQAPTGQLTAVIAVAKKMGAQIVPIQKGLLVKRAGRLVSPLFTGNGRISGLSDRPAVPDADGTVLRRRKLYGVGAFLMEGLVCTSS